MKSEAFIIGAIILVLALGIGSSAWYAYGTDEVVTDKIVKTERVVTKDSSRYIIYGEKEVYENTDSMWYWKYNSADFYRDIEQGKTYKLRVYGWRIPFFSMNRNIIEVSPNGN